MVILLRSGLSGLLLLAAAVVCPAYAQAIAAPTGPTGGLFGQDRPLDGTGPTNGLSTTWTVGWGYDENVEPLDTELEPMPGIDSLSGTLGTVEGSMRYRRGSALRFFEMNGLAYLQTASISPDRLIGGNVNMRGTTDFGGRNGITTSVDWAHQPTLLFNAFGPLEGQVEGGTAAGVNNPQGINESRWRAAQASGGFFRNWTPRQRMDVIYDYSQRYRATDGPRLENRAHAATVNHVWNFRQYAGLTFSYGYGRNRQDDQDDVSQALDTHTGTMTVRLVRPLAQTRQVVLSFGGGATRASTRYAVAEADFVLPVVSGSLSWDPARDWTISADARRDVTVLEGLSPEPFATNVFSLRTQSTPTRRLQLALSGSYSRGNARTTDTGSFSNMAGSAQAQYALSRCCAVYTSYTYYKYRLYDLTVVQPGFPSRYSLNSVRAGLTFWVPLTRGF